MLKNNPFLANYFLGFSIYFCGTIYFRIFYLEDGTNAITPEIFFKFYVFLSVITSVIASVYYNVKKPLPLQHPVVLFFRMIFSKNLFIPPLFFPAGAITAGFIFELFNFLQVNSINLLGPVKIGSGIYIFSLAGSFVGAFLAQTQMARNIYK